MVDFGLILSGGTRTVDITLTNIGDRPTGAITLDVSGADAAMFWIAASDCTTLAGFESCTVSVRFIPTSLGDKAAVLTAAAFPGGIVTSNLSGTVLLCAPPLIEPSPHDFGSVPVGIPGPTQTFTVRDPGSGMRTIRSVAIAGSHPADFPIVSDRCSGTDIPSGGSCTVDVRFEPSGLGSRSASLTVTFASSCGSTIPSALSGTGIGRLTITPRPYDFGLVASPASADFTVTNIGPGSSGPLSHSITGDPEFAITSSSCDGVSLAPGATCTLMVSFGPTGATSGVRTATLIVAGDGSYAAAAPLRGEL